MGGRNTDSSSSTMTRIADGIDQENVVRLTSDLIKFPTINPPGDERQVCEFIASWLDKRGINASLLEEVPGRTNVEAVVEGDLGPGRTLVLNGHTDVVPVGNGWTREPFSGEVEDGRVYGRGSADMKGGLAAMMVAAEAAHKHRTRLRGRLILQAVADEEVGGPAGTGFLVRRGLSGDLAIVGEPTGMDVCVCHKGVIRFDVTTFGKSAHSSVPWEGKSAILAMCTVMDALRDYGARLAKDRVHPMLGAPTVNIGVIEGGVAVNFVPDRCRIVAERRLVPPETIEQTVREVTVLVSKAAGAAGVKHELVFKSESMTSDASDEKEKVQVVLDAKRLATGGEEMPSPKGFLATCDARFLSNDARIPSLIFGPGSLAQVHAPDEYVHASELGIAAKVYALALSRLQSLGPRDYADEE